METKTITIRVPMEHAEWLAKNQEGMNAAIVDCIEKTAYINKYAMRDIKGKLTPSEWKFIADSLNGSIVEGDFRYVSGALIAHTQDADEFEGLGAKWNVNVEELCSKISKLSCCEIEAIYRRVEAFWEDSTQDMEEWSKF